MRPSMLKVSCLLWLLSLVFAGGCAMPVESGLKRPALFVVEPRLDGYPRLNSFLALRDGRSPSVRMTIEDIEVLAGDYWLPITRGPVVLDSESITGSQIFLGAVSLPPGHYNRLRLTLSSAETRTSAGGWSSLLVPTPALEIGLSEAIGLDDDDSKSLFITWDVQSSLEQENGFSPHLWATAAARQLPLDLLYVSCPDIDTIFVVRTDTNRVADSFGLKGRPTWISAAPQRSGGYLYALAAAERMIKLVDLSTYRTVNFFPVPLNDAPSFMTLDPNGEVAFLLDERSGYLSRMDLASGRIDARVLLGFQPQFARYLEEQNLLAVSLALSQKVVLLDPVSLVIRGSFSTGSRPQGLVAVDRQLYVAEQGDNTVAVIDLDQRSMQERIAVGFGPVRLLETANQIYISQEEGGSLAVLVPGQLGVMREIRNIGRPREMAYDPTYHRLYLADMESGGLVTIAVNDNYLLGRIILGAHPFALTVVK